MAPCEQQATSSRGTTQLVSEIGESPESTSKAPKSEGIEVHVEESLDKTNSAQKNCQPAKLPKSEGIEVSCGGEFGQSKFSPKKMHEIGKHRIQTHSFCLDKDIT